MLVPERGNRYHYVVVTGASGDEVVVHDPSWGPSRAMRAADFEQAWRAAGFWSLVILPPAAVTLPASDSPKATNVEAPGRPRERVRREASRRRWPMFARADSSMPASCSAAFTRSARTPPGR